MMGPFEEIRMVEVIKAIDSLTAGKAAGPDGIPIEPYREVPVLREYIRGSFNYF